MGQNVLQGHGVEGCYGGLGAECSALDTSQIVVLPIPFDQTTTYQQGTDRGPAALIEASRNLELYDIETRSEVYQLGIHTAGAVQETSSQAMLDAAYSETLRYLNMGKFVVCLGGEHAVSAAPIRAHAEKFGKISILQFDAHSDLAAAYEGNPLSHASVMARVREMKQVERIVSVGIRSMSVEESAVIEEANTFFAHTLHGSDAWMDSVVERLTDKVYITFDLDAFDSSLMPATGTPEPGGLFWHQALKLLKKVAEKKQVIGCDLVELCPIPNLAAPEFLAAKLLYKILSYVFAKK